MRRAVALSMLAGLGGMLLIGLAIGLMPGRAGATEDEGIGTTAVAELPAEAGTASAIAPDEVTTDANELLATTAPPSDQIHASDGPAGDGVNPEIVPKLASAKPENQPLDVPLVLVASGTGGPEDAEDAEGVVAQGTVVAQPQVDPELLGRQQALHEELNDKSGELNDAEADLDDLDDAAKTQVRDDWRFEQPITEAGAELEQVQREIVPLRAETHAVDGRVLIDKAQEQSPDGTGLDQALAAAEKTFVALDNASQHLGDGIQAQEDLVQQGKIDAALAQEEVAAYDALLAQSWADLDNVKTRRDAYGPVAALDSRDGLHRAEGTSELNSELNMGAWHDLKVVLRPGDGGTPYGAGQTMPIAAGYQLPTRQGDDLVLRAPVNVANTLHVTVPTRYDDVNGTGHELEGDTIHNAPTIRVGGTSYRSAFVQDPLSDVQDDNTVPEHTDRFEVTYGTRPFGPQVPAPAPGSGPLGL